MSENLNFNDALTLLNELSKTLFVVEAWIPSLKKGIKIQEINAKQQKSLIESAIDSESLKFNFSKYLYEIVCENCQESKDVIKDFTIADKMSIAFNMRCQISNTINLQFSETPKLEKSINLEDVITKFKEYEHPSLEKIKYSKSDVNIEVDINLPKFSEESKFDTYIYGNIQKGENELEEFKGLIGSAFLGETAKYIKEIYINNSPINYDLLHIPQKIQFVEKLPAALVQNIINNIVKWKESLENLSTFTHENIKKTVEVNSLLFINN